MLAKTVPRMMSSGAGAVLAEVARACGATVHGDASVVATGLRHDSRAIEAGDVFVARSGARFDGRSFMDQAIARGACAVLTDACACENNSVPWLVVSDIRAAMARAATVIYGDPWRQLEVVGITGTNGKTTTTALVHAALLDAGHRPAAMGTLGACFAQQAIHTQFNTPEADELTRIGAWMSAQGASHLVMEVTSHALAQQRTDGVRFRAAAFTNLTHDHLDLHGSFEAYGSAKARLFLDLRPQACAIMIDDAFGAALCRALVGRVLRVSTNVNAHADVRPACEPACSADGIVCAVVTPCGIVEVQSPLLGRHNLSNLLLALATAICLDLDADEAARAIGQCPAVPGRLQRCDTLGDDIVVFVDYAHTPDALERVLEAARMHTQQRVICVFGCGGDRDRLKRPVMGEVAGRCADVTILTSDNPRSEQPDAIADAVLEGLRLGQAEYVVELDRARAIHTAITMAQPGDVVLLAGKGHEKEQIIGRSVLRFDDCAQAAQALAARRATVRIARRVNRAH